MSFFTRFQSRRTKKWVICILKTAAALILTSTAIGILNAQEPEIKTAPLNPAFVKWQAAQKEKIALQGFTYGAEPTENRFGYIPEPKVFSKISRSATQIETMVKAGLALYPASFDLRTQDRLTPIRNQNPFGTCWAFGSIASIESNIKVTTGTSIDLSEWHLAWFTYNPLNTLPAFTKSSVKFGEDGTFDQGGNTYKALAIMSRGTGPVSEASAPYQSTPNYLPSALPKGTEPTVAAIKNAYLFETNDSDTIKGLLTTNGAVAILMCWPETNENFYYYSPNRTFRYVQSGELNHMVNIVGWDDNFPKTRFPASNQPYGDGAWIIRNSWGTGWGEGGYFYMSYDTNFGYVASYEADFEWNRKIYQYDFLGTISSLGWGEDRAWFSNIFTATGTEEITDIAFYTSAENASFEITIRTGVTGNPSTGVQVFGPQKGTIELPGYHRIKLTSPVRVSNGNKFAVIVRLIVPGYIYPVEIMYPYDGYSDSATALRGAGWISDGESWKDVDWMDVYDSLRGIDNISICLKAFTVSAYNPISLTINPSTATMVVGNTRTFTADVTGGSGDIRVTWSATGGNIEQSGVYTAPAMPGTYTVTATSVEDNTKSATATVTVLMTEPISVAISPGSGTMEANNSGIFKAFVTGGKGNTAVTWSASGPAVIIPWSLNECLYTAPSTPSAYTLTATSLENTAVSDSITITAIAASNITITSPSKTLHINETMAFKASASVAWSADVGDIDTGGNYKAPTAPQIATITATSAQNPFLMSVTQILIIKDTSKIEGNTQKTPQFLDFANAIGSVEPNDLSLYDLNNDGKIDETDIHLLFNKMGW
ncbi:MAG: lectin like domain-containing protein [Holophagales bacterium]|jgi:C1A family cysteine protease|nr:lectin like domain-containing protein [Holophagales bacterium]